MHFRNVRKGIFPCLVERTGNFIILLLGNKSVNCPQFDYHDNPIRPLRCSQSSNPIRESDPVHSATVKMKKIMNKAKIVKIKKREQWLLTYRTISSIYLQTPHATTWNLVFFLPFSFRCINGRQVWNSDSEYVYKLKSGINWRCNYSLKVQPSLPVMKRYIDSPPNLFIV